MSDTALTEAARTSPAYRWTRDEFVRASEAGVFERRVELVYGEVWSVVLGDWHGEVTFNVGAALKSFPGHVTGATLPAGESLPGPDCWVRRDGAQPTATIGSRLSAWAARDVLLVVEVSDETVVQDLSVKATLYGQAGYSVYWVVTRDGIYERSEPTQDGYLTRTLHRPGDRIEVAYADTSLSVSDLLAVG